MSDTPLAEKERLIEKSPRNRDVIFPYIGGEEINTSPIHAHHRYVINFRDWPLRRDDLGATWREASEDERREWRRDGTVPLDYPEPVAADWPEVLRIVEETVKPERDVQNRKALRERWWHYAEKRPGLYAAIDGLDRVLVRSLTSKNFCFSFLPTGVTYDQTLIVFPDATFSAFSFLQARPHEVWAN